MDAKNFYRALDYQGLTFKSNDRKAMATKSLIAELEQLHDEARSSDKAVASKYPLTFSFQDANVFRDITRLVFSYVEKQNGFSSSDRGKIRMFVRIFIPLFFHIDDVVPEGVALESDEAEDESGEDDDESHSINTEDSGETGSGGRSVSPATTPSASTSHATPTTRRRSGRHRADEAESRLLRDVLKRSKNASSVDDAESTQENGTQSPSTVRAQSASQAPEDEAEHPSGTENEEGAAKSEEPESAADEEEEAPPSPAKKATAVPEPDQGKQEKGNRLFAAAAAATAPGLHKRTVYSFFCNNAFYCFFRLYQVRSA